MRFSPLTPLFFVLFEPFASCIVQFFADVSVTLPKQVIRSILEYWLLLSPNLCSQNSILLCYALTLFAFCFILKLFYIVWSKYPFLRMLVQTWLTKVACDFFF